MAGMMQKERNDVLIAASILILLTLAGAYSTFSPLLFLWRSAARPEFNSHWIPRIYEWLAASVFIGAGWVAVFVWLLRRR
jgi:hypothetical protein